MKNSAAGSDVLVVLGIDLCFFILSMLEDPADSIRASCVSRAWFEFVIKSGLCKRLCIKLFAEVSTSVHAIEDKNMVDFDVVSSNFWELVTARKNHNVYATLARGLSPILRSDCIFRVIEASHEPEESIDHTLEPSDRIGVNSSYWSSAGSIDDEMSETLTYKLASGLCFITEINIRPFQAYFRHDLPIYSAKAVRFRLGYFKFSMIPAENHYVWTYESPEYPMNQIELLGGVQRCLDGRFYICVTHVQVVARTLLPEFERKLLNRSGNRAVIYPGISFEEEEEEEEEEEDSEGELIIV